MSVSSVSNNRTFRSQVPSLCASASLTHLMVFLVPMGASEAERLTDRAFICMAVVFLSSCNVPAHGRVSIAIRKYGFLLSLAMEEEEGCRSGQPSAQRALISHLGVIYCGLHRENSVYCNRDHNYHRSALSQDLCRVCVCECVCVCVFADGVLWFIQWLCVFVCGSLGGHLCMH